MKLRRLPQDGRPVELPLGHLQHEGLLRLIEHARQLEIRCQLAVDRRHGAFELGLRLR